MVPSKDPDISPPKPGCPEAICLYPVCEEVFFRDCFINRDLKSLEFFDSDAFISKESIGLHHQYFSYFLKIQYFFILRHNDSIKQ
jgi:hypothetical protein